MIKKYINKYKEDLANCVKDFKSIRTWYRQIPNLLTISRPIGIIPANILFFTGNIIPAVILTGILLLTDLIDGPLARKWKVSSKFGADLDAVCDKFMFLGLSLPLIVNFPSMLVTFLLEGAISGVNILGRLNGVDTKTVFIGKVKTVSLSLTLGIGYLVRFFNIPRTILNFFTIVTGCLQGCALGNYIYKYKEMIDEKNKNAIQADKEDEIIFEELDNKRQNILSEQLKKEREFYLGISEPGRVYTGKKRVRKMIHEKRNSH